MTGYVIQFITDADTGEVLHVSFDDGASPYQKIPNHQYEKLLDTFSVIKLTDDPEEFKGCKYFYFETDENFDFIGV